MAINLTLRAVKGSPLTNLEVDNNFSDLESGTLHQAENLNDVANKATSRVNLDVPSRGGVGASGTWNISISGTAAIATTALNADYSDASGTVTNGVYTVGDQTIGGIKTFSSTIVGNVSGSAGTAGVATSANTLTTARLINGTSFNGSAAITTTNWGSARVLTIGATGKSVNGSAAVAWSLSEIGAAARTLTLTAGDGISGGGDLTSNRTFDVDSTVVRTSGAQTIEGSKTFATSPVKLNNTVRLDLGTTVTGQLWSNATNSYFDMQVGNFLYRDNTSTRFTFARTTGDFTAVGNITAFSDLKIKEDIQIIPDALNKVLTLGGYTYKRKDTGSRQAGVIAQELQEVLPEAVQNNEGDILSVSYGSVIGLLVEAIKDLSKENTLLKQRLDALESK